MIYSNYDFDRIFENFFSNPNVKLKSTSNLDDKYEVNYTKDGAYLLMEAPGFNKTNLKVEMENGFLFVEGKRTYKLNGEEVSRTISRRFQIGDGYQSEAVEATIEDGLLTVFVPNMKKIEKKRISIL